MLRAFALHAAIAVLCRSVRFGTLARLLARVYPLRDTTAPPDLNAESRVVLAVSTAGSLCPFGTTCLTAALTAQCLLRRMGGDAVLRIGVRPDTRPTLTAHAWIESAGRALPGLPAADGYVTLNSL